MTQKEIEKFLDNTKVYVNGKSEEIQKKLFSFGFHWFGRKENEVQYTQKPFLFISDENEISYSSDVIFFKKHEYTEITAEQILSLELTEPTYRPFRDREECWNEMLKHQPFGWIKNTEDGDFYQMGNVHNKMDFKDLLRIYQFADGIPFGINEE